MCADVREAVLGLAERPGPAVGWLREQAPRLVDQGVDLGRNARVAPPKAVADEPELWGEVKFMWIASIALDR